MAYLCFTLGGAFKMSPILPPLSTHFARMSNRMMSVVVGVINTGPP